MRGTFDVFIDSPWVCLTPPESTEFVEAFWRRREPLPGTRRSAVAQRTASEPPVPPRCGEFQRTLVALLPHSSRTNVNGSTRRGVRESTDRDRSGVANYRSAALAARKLTFFLLPGAIGVPCADARYLRRAFNGLAACPVRTSVIQIHPATRAVSSIARSSSLRDLGAPK